MKRRRRTRQAGMVLVVGLLLALGGASTTALADPSDGAISGTVTDAASHSGLAGIDVCAEEPTTFEMGCTTSGVDGSYSIPDLPPASYTVRFYGTSAYINQYFDGVTNYNDADLVQVAAGVTSSSIDAEMHSGGRITGTVTNAISHAPVAGITACAEGVSGTTYHECGGTDSSGVYEIHALPTGSYKVRFYEEEGYAGHPRGSSNYLEQYYDDKATEGEAAIVSVTVDHVTTGIDAAMHEGGRITGIVTDAETGDPIPYAAVCASHAEDRDALSDRCSDAQESNASGEYLIAGLSTGSYAVWLNHPNDGPPWFDALNYVPQFYSDKSTFETANLVSVTALQTTPHVDFALHKGGRILATIVDAETHQPLSDISICPYKVGMLDFLELPLNGCDYTGADGQFTMIGYPTGEYRLSLRAYGSNEGIYPDQYANGKGSIVNAARIAVVAGQDTGPVNVELFKIVEGSEPEEKGEEEPTVPGPSDPGPGSGNGSPDGGSGAPPATQPGPTTPRAQPGSPKSKMAVTLSAPTQSLDTIIKSGAIKTSCRLSSAGRCTVVAAISAKDAKALGLKVKKGAKTVTIGRGKVSLGEAGSANVTIKLSGKVRSALRGTAKLKIRLTVTATGPGRKPTGKSVTLTARS